MAKAIKTDKPLEVAPFANKAHEEAMARKERERKKTMKRNKRLAWLLALSMVIMGSLFAWIVFLK